MSDLAIGVDLGGTSLRVGAYTGGLEPVESLSMVTRVEAGPEAVVTDIAEAIKRLLKTNLGSSKLAGVGIGSPGPINLIEGTLGRLPNFPGWDGFPLRGALEQALGLPVTLECDANAAALAEWKAGAGSTVQVESMCMITLGTGVGSGIILDGKIWHGMVGMGGEAGHVPILPDGPLCGCGSRGCLEMYASATGLVRTATELAASGQAEDVARLIEEKKEAGGVTARDLALLARSGSASAIHLFNRLGFHLGLGLAGLVSTLDLPLYVIGGGVASAWDLFSDEMFKTLHDYSYVYRLGEPSQRLKREVHRTFVCPAQIGPGAGLLGAAMLPAFAPALSVEVANA
ncbi:MAG TPA: ROK family protein [Granulicella sp.]|nr:ROK family protein [Granulicella sp.]